MVWNFTGGGSALPQLWTEEAFFGNGLLGSSLRVLDIDGSLVLSETSQKNIGASPTCPSLCSHRMHIGRSDVWDKRDGKSKLSMGNDFQFDRPRLPIGYFDLKLLGTKVLEGTMRLHLWDATVTGHVKTDRGSVTFKAFVHATHNVVVMEVTRYCALLSPYLRPPSSAARYYFSKGSKP
eukprot:9497506-Pyramimonas_sp.AAC.1